MINYEIGQSLAVATEAVDFQYNPKLFNEMSEVIEEFRQSVKSKQARLDTRHLRRTKLKDIISRHTGMHCICEIYDSHSPNAFVLIPEIGRSNPIFAHYYERMPYNKERDIDKMLSDKLMIEGTVDLERGQVSGVYSELSMNISISSGLIRSDSEFTSAEIAAIILHELGHLFSFLESMNYSMRRNWMLFSRLKDFRGGDKAMKLKMIDELKAEKLLDREFPTDEVITMKDSEKASMLILTKAAPRVYTDPNTVCYDNVAFESASDQFAVRMGAGDSLATSLAKLYKQGKITVGFKFLIYSWRWISWVSMGLSLIVAIFSPAFILGLWYGFWFVVGSIFQGAAIKYYQVYDLPKDRLKRIKQELITPLKDANVPAGLREELVSSCDRIEQIFEDQKWQLWEGKDPTEWFTEVVLPWANANYRSKIHQQILEDLQNNELYLAASRFK